MGEQIITRLKQLGIVLPPVSPAGANYVQSVLVGSTLMVSGQLPKWENERRYMGRLGDCLSLLQGQGAARLCAINILAVVQEALGNLDRVIRCTQLRGYVNATPAFQEYSQVINGASDLIVDVFGEAGRHTRIAIGASLPYGCAVEVEANFEVRLP